MAAASDDRRPELHHTEAAKMQRVSSPSKKFLKVIVVGDYGVDKARLVHEYVSRRDMLSSRNKIGAGFWCKTIEIDDGQCVELQIWDIAGQERYRSVTGLFFRGSDCAILVYNEGIQTSFENLEYWLGEVKEKAGDIPTSIIRIEALQAEVSDVEVKEWLERKGNIPCYPSSIKEEAFLYVARLAMADHHDLTRTVDIWNTEDEDDRTGCTSCAC